MNCSRCKERPRRKDHRGRIRGTCVECVPIARKENAKRLRAAAERQRLQGSPVPIELRRELAGFARELGFVR